MALVRTQTSAEAARPPSTLFNIYGAGCKILTLPLSHMVEIPLRNSCILIRLTTEIQSSVDSQSYIPPVEEYHQNSWWTSFFELSCRRKNTQR